MMNENETYCDDIKAAAEEAFLRFKEAFEKAQEAFCEIVEDVSDSFKKAFEELKNIDLDREPLPRPQKYICKKNFVLDRRKTINRIKKKKGTVYRIH